MSTLSRSQYVPGIAALCASFFVSATAEAHFVLTSPPASTEQNVLGDPQKAPPCGDDGSAVATGVVTPYQAGETITVTIDETVYHPGHYRIAIAMNDPSELPPEPIVTPGSTPCGSAPIDAAPVFPVLADGVFEHSSPFGEPQSIEITLPDVTCTNCTLQIIQFMSEHGLNDPGGCYYHHCAAISIEGGPVDPTTTSGDDSADGTSDDGATTVTTNATNATTADDGSTGMGDASDTLDEGSTAANADSGTGALSDTEPGQEMTDGGCSCALPAGGSDRRLGMLGGVVGMIGMAGLRRRRSIARA